MRLLWLWAVLFALAGCQTTPPTSLETPKLNKSDTSLTSVTVDNLLTVETQDPNQAELIPDLWQRVIGEFSWPIPEHKDVDQLRNWYLERPEHIQQVAKRAEPFLYLIADEIKQRDLPMELILLPVVESAFDPFAHSSGNAAGLWQFLASTGKAFGLTQDYWYDGRRDIVASTQAALSYLIYLNKRFDGDWFHAIAAYNAGEGRVARAIKKNKEQQLPTDFFSLDLPKQTTAYLPKLLALADILRHSEHYALSLPQLEDKPQLTLVDPKQQLDLAIAAQLSALSLQQLQHYNPAYNQWFTSPDGPQSLLLPVENAVLFEAQLAKQEAQGIKVIRYQVAAGDTLSEIAQQHNSSITMIQNANQLTNNTIKVGQSLIIPIPSVEATQLSQTAQARFVSPPNIRVKNKQKTEYQAKSGDSLWSIAKRYQVSTESLATWNRLNAKSPLQIGQQLIIWQEITSSPSTPSIIRTVNYPVKAGDTLSTIAMRFNVSVNDIVQLNNLVDHRLKIGQMLKLSVDVTRSSS